MLFGSTFVFLSLAVGLSFFVHLHNVMPVMNTFDFMWNAPNREGKNPFFWNFSYKVLGFVNVVLVDRRRSHPYFIDANSEISQTSSST